MYRSIIRVHILVASFSNLNVKDWMLQDRIRRQISSPLALSRVSEHKKPSSGRLGAACPSAGAFALHYAPPPPPKFTTVEFPSEPLLLPQRVIKHWSFSLPWSSSGPVVYGVTKVDPLETSSKPARSATSRKGKERRRSQKVGAAAQAHEQVGQRGSESRVDCALIRRLH